MSMKRVRGLARLTETAPVHARGVSKLFVAQLDDQELAILESALGKVTVEARLGWDESLGLQVTDQTSQARLKEP